MLGTIVETINRLKERGELSKEDQELLEFLHQEAWKEINLGMINLITYGDRLGEEEMKEKFAGLLALISKSKDG